MSLSPFPFFFFLLVFSRELDNEMKERISFYQGCEGERENKGGRRTEKEESIEREIDDERRQRRRGRTSCCLPLVCREWSF